MAAATASRLRISEIFASVQGEGIWTGIPSTFVRVSGCNLRCRWCDTPYASWNPEGPVLPVEEVFQTVLGHGLDHIVITGGEPMLFEGVVHLAEMCKSSGKKITIETAGTVFRELPCDLMSVSPKLAHSTPDDPEWRDRHEKTRLNKEVLQQLIDRYPVQFKFVVNPEAGEDLPMEDLREIEGLLAELTNLPSERVLLMPEGTDSETLNRRARLLVPEVMRRNWRLTSRMHIDLFGNTKGT